MFQNVASGLPPSPSAMSEAQLPRRSPTPVSVGVKWCIHRQVPARRRAQIPE